MTGEADATPPSSIPPASISIVHEGPDYVVVDKPAGLFTHRTKLDARLPGMAEVLRAQLQRRVHLVHRLDRPVSGLLLVALDAQACARLQAAMQDEDAIKEYLALVRGRTDRAFDCSEALKNKAGKLQHAETRYRRVRSFPWCSLVAVRIRTGRRHQIRRHCDRVQHQILGDRSYGKSRLNDLYRERYGLARPFLHARRLRLPTEGLDLTLRLPGELVEVLRGLALDSAEAGHGGKA